MPHPLVSVGNKWEHSETQKVLLPKFRKLNVGVAQFPVKSYLSVKQCLKLYCCLPYSGKTKTAFIIFKLHPQTSLLTTILYLQ